MPTTTSTESGEGTTGDQGVEIVAKWRPIETAPRDRNIIITGKYENGISYVEESYWHYRGHWNARRLDPPTHWMPFPQPPLPDHQS